MRPENFEKFIQDLRNLRKEYQEKYDAFCKRGPSNEYESGLDRAYDDIVYDLDKLFEDWQISP